MMDKNVKEILTGTILKGVGGNYTVDCNGRILEGCKASGRLRQGAMTPVCGDIAEVEVDPADGSGYMIALQPRRSFLIRPAIANIDRLFILASQAPPMTDPTLVDKVCVIALRQGIEPIILLNKGDIDASDNLYETYRAVGLQVLRVSALTGQGIEAVADLIAGKTSAFTGNSAIGKSSLLNRLDHRFQLTVGDMSAKIARGKNTTRHVELLRAAGGLVADTPGFSSFDIAQMDYIPAGELQLYFPEMERLFGQCRFADCAHINEPGCAVIEQITRIPALKSRHESYCKIYGELKQLKEWEQK